MPTLEAITNTTEDELVSVLIAAWGVPKVKTSLPEVETALSGLPEAFLILASAETTEAEDGVIGTESARLQWVAYLRARKPTASTDQLARVRRGKAQDLRTELKAADLTEAAWVRWLADDYLPEDAELEATAEAYVLRVRFETYVEWTEA